MTFLSGALASVVEWLLSKGFVAAEGAIGSWFANRKQQAALAANQTNLQAALKTGNEVAIENADTSALNNTQPK